MREAEKQRLLELAHRAVEMAARERRPWEPPPESNPRLTPPRAVFVSLHKSGLLRGCIGQVVAHLPLHRAVAEAAYSAAREDPRFAPVSPEELPEITVEISVLSPFHPIRPEEIQVGVHGLMLSRGRLRGLLLPQVATHYDWKAPRFLEETCRKAGLPPDAWRHGATIEAFTAEVFRDEEKN